jgi:aminomethyltransferase
MSVAATPFHLRAAECNHDNAWCERNGFTVAAHFGDAEDEAMSARMSAIVTDISWRSRIRLSGAHALECVSRLVTRDPSKLGIGQGIKALWLNDAGGVRGAGVLVRRDVWEFELISAADDFEWIVATAKLFGVSATDVTREGGGIAIIGPQTVRLLSAAGLRVTLDQLSCVRFDWGGVGIELSRFGEHMGFEIWCEKDDAPAVWDRIARAGAAFALRMAGAEAMDTLDIEAGIARPWRDYAPARDASSPSPTPAQLSLESLIDESHRGFNGFRSWDASRHRQGLGEPTLAGIVVDGDRAVPYAALLKEGRMVGRTLSSRYSPSLRRSIALAEIDAARALPGTILTMARPGSLAGSEASPLTGRVAALPFLPTPDSIAP